MLKRLEQAVLRGDHWVSAVTYAEMRFRATGPKPRRAIFSWSTRSARLDASRWDRAAVDADGHPVALRHRDADRPE